MIARNLRYRRAVSRLLQEVVERDSNTIEVGAGDSSVARSLTTMAPEGRHLRIAEADGRIERLDAFVDPSEPIRFIAVAAGARGLLALRGAHETLRRDRPYTLVDLRTQPDDESGPGFGAAEIYDLLTECGLELGTLDMWFAQGHLARLGRNEFVDASTIGDMHAVLAHPPPLPPASSDQRTTMTKGLVTVVVPTLNEEAAIDACLRTIRSQTYDRLEILVVDGGSADRTCEIVDAHAAEDRRVYRIGNPDRAIPAALNRALVRASGEWMVRVDAHATIPTDYVDRLVGHLSTGRWGGVGGRKDGAGGDPMGRAIAFALGSPFGVGNSVYHHGTVAQVVDHLAYGAYPLAVARAVGGWNPRLLANEDYEFDHRVQEAGHELLFDPEIRVRWVSQQSLRGLGRQYRRYGRAKAQVMQLTPSSTKVRHLAAPSLVAWTALAAIVGTRRPRLSLAMMGPYAAAVALATAHSARTLPPVDSIRTAPAFVTMHYAWGIGWWERILLRRSAMQSTSRPVKPEPAGLGS